MGKIACSHGVEIDEAEISETFVKSAGPGGQNVNKVATTVQLRFDVGRSPALTEEVRHRLVKIAGRRMTKDRQLVIVANRFRTQERNREDARARLIALISEAAQPPPPLRRKTRPTRASRERRLSDKKALGETKQNRKKPTL